ncbi:MULTISPECIES: hypothetical protein [Acinetobacter calcoaceticus/baumannii complex]|nr:MULTISPECIES: hypothetical protein [Acinetobacter calcoaceticus/baumannii complex]MDW8487098.1 hypothetical protein [Acinetobacter sp. OYA S30]OUC65599.1 hypothetical protein MWQ_03814 [Acinetobacter seifertii]
MVAKRKRVSRLIAKGSAHPKVSPSRSAAEGARRVAHQKDILFSVLWLNGLLKPTDDVGQQLNDKIKVSLSQSSDMKKQIKSKVENAFYVRLGVYLTMTINDRFILNACAGLRLVIAGDIYIIDYGSKAESKSAD